MKCHLLIRNIDSGSFQAILDYLKAPGAINRKIISQEITLYYQNKKVEIENSLSYLRDLCIKFSLCLDCWTSKTQHVFLGVLIHYINIQWQQESFLLDFADLRQRYTGRYLYKTSNKVLAG